MMNQDIFEGKWNQLRGEAHIWWGKLTDDDLQVVGGRMEQLVGVIQTRYGYTRAAAEEEVTRRFAEYEEQQKKVTAPLRRPGTPSQEKP